MNRAWHILLPALIPTGPVKGAFALANALAAERMVSIVALRAGPGAGAPLDPRVRVVSLAGTRAFPGRVRAYRQLLEAAGGRRGAVSLSMCLSADAVNSRCRGSAITGVSVRGNLPQNYRFDYGMPGLAVAWAHLRLLRSFDVAVAMTDAMATQIRRVAGRSPAVIGNFVDEAALEKYRAPPPLDAPRRIVFLGALSRRKQPQLALRALQALVSRGIDARLDLLGQGELELALNQEAHELGVQERVAICGFMPDPYARVAGADALLLPSRSEGVSRASLEALHLGVPCVLRNVDGNAELIERAVNGDLFDDVAGIAPALERAFAISRAQQARRPSLLPASFRQAIGARQYLETMEGIEA